MPSAPGLVLLAVLALTAAGAISSAPPALAAGSDDGSLTLTVPPGTTQNPPVFGGSPGAGTKPSSGSRRPATSPSAAPVSVAPDPVEGTEVVPAVDVVADLGRRRTSCGPRAHVAGHRRSGPLGLGAAGALAALALAARAIARANGAGGVS